jgi:hypothetical protein
MTLMFQFNCQKSPAAASNIINYLSRRALSTFLVALHEPCVYKGKVTTFPGIKFTGTTDPNLQPRAAIWASSNMNLWNHQEYSDRDMVTVVWNNPMLSSSQMYITSMYCDINLPMVSEKLQKLVTHCRLNDMPLLVLADSNAHSSLWGCQIDNERGTDLENFLIDSSLMTLNVGNTPTFDCNRGRTIIDISIASPEVSELTESWRVLDENFCSDHKCIEIKLNIEPQIAFFRNYTNTNWDDFRNFITVDMLARQWPQMWSPDTIEATLAQWYKSIQLATERVAPLIKRKTKISISWYTNDLRQEKIKLDKLNKRVKTGKAPQEEYNTARRRYKNNILKAKHKSWQIFTEAATDVKQAAKLEKIIQGMPQQRVNFLKRQDGSMAETPEESANLLLSEHFPGSINYTSDPDDEWVRSLQQDQLIPDLPWLTKSLVKEAFEDFGSDKAAGPDGLKPGIIQKLPDEAFDRLKDIFTACIRLGYTPETWRTSRTIFIPKPDKDDYTKVRSFRPISLTSFLFKGLEKIVQKHINVTLHKNQHAFRQGRSTDSALSRTVDLIEKAIQQGQYCLAVFLDIEGAFDNLAHNAVETALNNHDVDPMIIKWYMQYMRNRIATLDLKGTFTKKEQICNGGWSLRSHTVTTENCPQPQDGSIIARQPRQKAIEKVKATQLTIKNVQFGSTF